MAKKTFILSDQTKNYYGFVVLTAGISLGRFKENPLMLYNHSDTNKPEDVIGNWENIRHDDLKLLADEAIDREDEFGARVAKKVDKNLIKGASVRLHYNFEDVKLDVNGYEGIPVVTKCELLEASIVSLPNNKSAVKLFCDGKEITDNTVALSLTENFDLNHKNTEAMNKELELIFIALGLTYTPTSTPAIAVEAINALKGDKDSMKTQITELNVKLSAVNEAKIVDLITQAKKDNKLSVDQEATFTALAKNDFENTKKIIDGMVSQKPITALLNLTGDKGESADPHAGWDYKKFQKEAPDVLLSIKNNKPELYKTLWQAAYPNGKFNG